MMPSEDKNPGSKGNSNFFTIFMVILILISGIVFSFFFYYKLCLLEDRDIELHLKSHIDSHFHAYQREMDVRFEALESIRSLYKASEFVSRNEFAVFTAQILKRHKDIFVCEWLPQVTEDGRQEFEQAARLEGFKNFQITQTDDEGKIVKAKKRKSYFPVFYVEPQESNRKVIGFDVVSNPVWKNLLLSSSAANQLLATKPVSLIQGSRDKCVIIALPVFQDSPGDSVKENKSLRGFVAMIIDLKTSIATAIPAECNGKEISLEIKDGEEVVFEKKTLSSGESKNWKYQRKFNIFHSEWSIAAVANSLDLEHYRTSQPFFALITGIFFSLLLALYISLLQRRSREISDLVEKRTAELKKTHSQLLHSEKLSAIGRLSASIAHEFNNPLYGVTSVIQGIKRRTELSKQDTNLIHMASQECERMKNLIKDLQEFNRPTSGEFGIIDIHKTIDHILLLGKKEFDNRNIRIKKQFAEDMPPIGAIADQIKQVILNLINNAADACKDRGSIKIKTEVLDDKIAVHITDNGHGISPEHLEHIFEPFFTTKPEIKGIGLGLSVSYGIVKRHGGELKVESKPGKGSTFTLILPLETVQI